MLIVLMNYQVVLCYELWNCLFSSLLIKHGPRSPLLKEAVKEALKLLLLSIWILRGHLYQLGTSVISIITAIEDLKV